MRSVDFVIPVFDEQESLLAFHTHLDKTSLPEGYRRKYIYVNDGSKDSTQRILQEIAAGDDRVTIIELSRNFGHQAALSAGLEAASGDIVISMDGDGQHPPSVIPEMLRLYSEGYDIVRAQRLDDAGEGSAFKRLTSRWFYQLISLIGEVDIAPGASDFRLLSRRVLDALLQLPEYHRFYRGMTVWIGFPAAVLNYKAGARIGGKPKYSLKKMLRLASDGLFSFSLVPLRIALILGLSFIGLAAAELLYVAFVWTTGRGDVLVPGWTSLILILTVSGAINMILVGILGLYVGMIFHEVKRRPVYVVKSKLQNSPHIGEVQAQRSRRIDRTTTPD